MDKNYICLSTWSDKITHSRKSNLAEIKAGINKNGDSYQFTDTNNTMVVDETHPVGTIICYTMTANTDSSNKATSSKT